jgi:hypothetical protein
MPVIKNYRVSIDFMRLIPFTARQYDYLGIRLKEKGLPP